MGDFEDGAGHVAMYAKEQEVAMRAAMYMYSSAAVTPQSFEFIEYLL